MASNPYSLEHVRAATDSAAKITSELSEARIAAEAEDAKRFVIALIMLEEAGNALRQSLLQAGLAFRTVAIDNRAPSVHDLLADIAFEVYTNTYASTRRGNSDRPPGEVWIDAFLKCAPTVADLNRLEALREQEFSSATANPPILFKATAAAANGARDKWWHEPTEDRPEKGLGIMAVREKKGNVRRNLSALPISCCNASGSEWPKPIGCCGRRTTTGFSTMIRLPFT